MFESSLLDDQLPSPTISTSSLVSECPESISLESENWINDEQVPSTISPTKLAVSPVSEFFFDPSGF
jgi:hypothetical protein